MSKIQSCLAYFVPFRKKALKRKEKIVGNPKVKKRIIL